METQGARSDARGHKLIRFRPLLLMTVLTLLALAALIALGRWQWERYESKVAAAEADRGGRAVRLRSSSRQP
jgi:cytochrome oxidase assembly protein ShyY1